MHSTTKGQAMKPRKTRIFTPSRIVALALIAILAGGLAYVRFGMGSDSVSVPSGAKAGDFVVEPCDYATEDGRYAADCGTLVVPENRADAQSRLIAIPVTRIKARSAHPGDPIFRLEGGPGKTNMQFKNASRLADKHDVVLVGYRGVDGSSVLDCPEVESALKHSKDLLGDKSLSTYGAAIGECADRLSDDGVDLAGYTPTSRVDDLEAARVALGYDRIDLVSESAGTRTAMIYSWRYPKSIHRSVMIAVNPPGHFLWPAKTTDEQIGRYSELCAKDDDCSKRTDDLAASMRKTAQDIPDRWGFLPIKEGNVRLATFFGLVESTQEAAPISGPMTVDSWLSAADGDASGFWLQSLLSDLVFPQSFVWGEYFAFGSADDRPAKDHFAHADSESILGDPATNFVWGGGELADAWPAAPDAGKYSRVRRSKTETLLIGGTLDFATPPQAATKELLPYLPNGHQVLLPGFGHSDTFWAEQADAGTHLINTYFDTGRVDDSRYQRQTVDFTPEVTQTALAKGFAGVMVGLPILILLSLAWMARRVHKRGRIGRKSAATLRSLFPIVLGLGGWFAGVLIAMTTMPGVALDDEFLAALSIGAPIGVGIYLAWVNRDWSARTKAAGFAATAGGALLGAWLGFNAIEGVAAVLTTIVGATAAANLLLITLDMAWNRQARDRFAEAGAKETLEARSSVG